jgi:hypothetical protein
MLSSGLGGGGGGGGISLELYVLVMFLYPHEEIPNKIKTSKTIYFIPTFVSGFY